MMAFQDYMLQSQVNLPSSQANAILNTLALSFFFFHSSVFRRQARYNLFKSIERYAYDTHMAHVNRCCDHVRNTRRNRHTISQQSTLCPLFVGGRSFFF